MTTREQPSGRTDSSNMLRQIPRSTGCETAQPATKVAMRGDAATALDIKLQGSRCKAKRHQHRKPALPKYDACCHHLSGDYDNTRTPQRTHWLMAPLHASAQRHAGLKGASFWKTPHSSPTPGYRCDERCPRVGNTSRWVRRLQAAIHVVMHCSTSRQDVLRTQLRHTRFHCCRG